MTKFSFIIVNRNRADVLLLCVNSIKSLNIKDSEIILVDDNSTDESANLSRELVDIIVLNKKRMGIGHSRNLGLAMAKGKYTVVIDSDLKILKFDSKHIESSFLQQSNLIGITGIYSSNPSFEGGWNKALDLRRRYLYRKSKQGYVIDLSTFTTFSGGFCILNRSLLGKFSFEKENSHSGEDIIFELKLLNIGYIFRYEPNFVAQHMHYRSGLNIWKKLLTEVRGSDWVLLESIKRKYNVPFLEQIFSFPIFACISLFINLWPIVYILWLIELSPYLFVLLREKGSLQAFRLIFYSVIFMFCKTISSFLILLNPSYSIYNKALYLRYLVLSGFFSKIKFFYNL